MTDLTQPAREPPTTGAMRKRLLIQILPLVAVAIAALTAIAVTAASHAQRDAVYDQMGQLIGKEANRFDARARAALAVTHDLAATLEADSGRTARASTAPSTTSPSATPSCSAYGPATSRTPTTAATPSTATRRTATATGRFTVWSERTGGALKSDAERTRSTTRGPTTTTTCSR